MTSVRCPLCACTETFVLQRTLPLGSDDPLVKSTLASVGDEVRFQACLVCALIFRTPRPSAAHLTHYYEKVLPPLEPGMMASLGVSQELAAARNERRFALLFDQLQHAAKRELGHIVDIGGWDGRSLVPWRAAGWTTTLVEPGAKLRKLPAGITAVEAPEDLRLATEGPADVVTTYHCIEHVLHLGAWLQSARTLSRRGTLWVVEVPFDILYVRGLLRRAPLATPQIHDQHLSFFTPLSLRSAATALGLHVVDCSIIITPYWHGPTVSLRLLAHDAGEKSPGSAGLANDRPLFASELAFRAHFASHLLPWRRWAGLKFRAHRLMTRVKGAGLSSGS